MGICAVLSQRSPYNQKLHPCAFSSRRLSPAEVNYDVGNRKLLAVVLALKEWRHWLEGAEIPFLVWTDHKNLSYIRSAKRLSPCQARWALFLSRFTFTLSYRPFFGSQSLMLFLGSSPWKQPPLTQKSSFLCPALWEQLPGHLKLKLERLKPLTHPPVTALPAACLFLNISALLCFNGGTPQS